MPVGENELQKEAERSVPEVNRLLKQFEDMKKMMKQMTGMQQKGKKKGGLNFHLNRFNCKFFLYGKQIVTVLFV